MTHQVLRDRGMTKILGNPGSTELNFLTHFPEDFHDVLGLQEAAAIADGLAQTTGNAAIVNLRSAAEASGASATCSDQTLVGRLCRLSR